jgi:DNA-binding CsgD family transcriptional regulator/predicted enzyme related to lactoylglutathione lyase
LTPAEWRTVHAVQHGLTSREIAERRGISIDAVKFHVANALAKLGVANRKALRHWIGAPKHSALMNEENTVVEPLALGPIGQISRSVRNIEEAQDWYGKVLGIAHLFTFGKLAFFDCGGTRLMLSQAEQAPAAESMIYLRVENIANAHEELTRRGVEFINAPHMIHKHGILQGSRGQAACDHVASQTVAGRISARTRLRAASPPRSSHAASPAQRS